MSPQSPCSFSALARLYLLCAPNQNRHATQARGKTGLPLASLRSWRNYFCACESFCGEGTILAAFLQVFAGPLPKLSRLTRTIPPATQVILYPENTAGISHQRNDSRNSILMTCHNPDLLSASGWLKQIFNWVLTRHQYHHSSLDPLSSVEVTPYYNASSANSLTNDLKLSSRS